MATALLCAALFAIVTTSLRSQHATFLELTGTGPGEQCGSSVAFAGYLDGDLTGDLFVGCRGAQVVRAVSGVDGQVLWTTSGPQSFGHSIAAVGDLSGDGKTDVAVGAPGSDAAGRDSGRVTVLSGSDGSIVTAGVFPIQFQMVWDGEAPGDQLGWCLAAADLTGDGSADIVAGAPTADEPTALLMEAGMVTAWDGQGGLRLFRYYGTQADERLGEAVTELGDISGDLLPEISIGVPRYDNPFAGIDAGRVVTIRYDLVVGPQFFGGTLYGTTAGERFGTTVQGVGDVGTISFPGNQYPSPPDLLVGAPLYGPSNRGRVYLASGSELGAGWIHVYEGESPGDQIGRTLVGPGDMDGDFVPDLVFSATSDDNHGADAGCVYVYSGADPASALYLFNGDEPGDSFGWAIAAAHHDAFAFPTLVFGVPFSDSGHASGGLVRWVDQESLRWHGSVGFSELVSCSPSCPSNPFLGAQSSATLLHDVDADGRADLALCHKGTLSCYSQSVELWAATVPDFLTALTTAGDVDGDGFDDLVVGASVSGIVEVRSGVDGSLIHSISGAPVYDNLGESVIRVGDLNGDGYADIVSTAHPAGDPTITRVNMYSGYDGSHPWSVIVTAASTVVAGIGDTDGDGLPELAIANPTGTVTIRDGRTAAPLLTTTPVPQGPITAIGGIEDVNVDGFGDFALVTADRRVRAYSGANGAVLWTADLSPAAAARDRIVAVGDQNGDGRPDVLVGSPDYDSQAFGMEKGAARILSGVDGTLLWLTQAPALAFELGLDAGGGKDFSGDGRPDVVLGYLHEILVNPFPPQQYIRTRMVTVIDTPLTGTPPRVIPRGVGCPGTGGLPSLDVQRLPGLGDTVDVWLRAAPPAAPVALFLGAAGRIDLTALGAPGCSSLINLGLSVSVLVTTQPQGTAKFSLTIPIDTAFVGASLTTQWFVVDPPANPLGLTVSGAHDLVIGAYR